MKADRGKLEAALKSPASVRLFLFHGPDEAASRALAKRIAEACGPEAERVDLSSGDLKGDPGRLADEAASISLFGGARHVRVEPATDDAFSAVELLLGAPAAGNPVALIAGALKPTSKLLKLALASPEAMVFASYVADLRDAPRLVSELGREVGLLIAPDLGRGLFETNGGNREMIHQELEKLALFLNAAPGRAQTLDEEAISAVGANHEEGDLSRLVDAVAGGRLTDLGIELSRLGAQRIEGILVLRAVARRFLLLARLRAALDGGKRADEVMASEGKSLFWKEKPTIADQMQRWSSEMIARALDRLGSAGRAFMSAGGMGQVGIEEELLTLARQAARVR